MNLAIDKIRTDGNTQPRATLDEATIRDYALDMLEGDEFPPLVVFHDGADYWLAAGFHRLAAAASIGVTEFSVIVRKGGPREAYLFAVDDNRKNGVRYTNKDKHRIVQRFLSDDQWGGWSDSEISRRCGVSHPFVGELRRSLVTVTSEERTYIDRYGNTSTMHVANIGTPRLVDRPVENLPFTEAADDDDSDEYDNEPRDEGGFTDQQYHAAHYIEDLAFENNLEIEVKPAGYDGDEWYTPAEYIEAARAVLGVIDLDPASNDEAQAVVQAARYYTADDDGLDQPWYGRVWLNPPYSMPLIQKFTKRAIDAYENLEIESAIILTNNCTDAGWFHALMQAYPVCFTRGRIGFWRPDRSTFATRQGQAFFYLGDNLERFYVEFRRFGLFPNRFATEVAI